MDRPDFSGTWKWNPRRSALQISGPDSTLFVIEHREPLLRLTRTHRVAGKSDTFTIDLTTDGRETVVDRGSVRLRARAFWDEQTLVFDTTIRREEDEASNVVRYAMDPTGEFFVAEERFRSRSLNYDNRWVLEREGVASPDSH